MTLVEPAVRPNPFELLRQDSVDAPAWLNRLNSKSRLNARTLRSFLESRTVFYPGAGDDRQAFELFCGTNSSCCIVHADYGYGGAADYPKGYRQIFRTELDVKALVALGFQRRHPFPEAYAKQLNKDAKPPSAFWAVLERKHGVGSKHGAKRIAFLHVCAEAVWAYWNLWENIAKQPPYAVLLQDHGGCEIREKIFGEMGVLYQVAARSGLPTRLLVADNTYAWPGYKPDSDWTEEAGMGHHRRRLWSQGYLEKKILSNQKPQPPTSLEDSDDDFGCWQDDL